MGLVDVDAMTVSMARLVPAPLLMGDATMAVVVGVGSNSLGKVVIDAVIGRGRFAVEVATVAVGCPLVGCLTFLLSLAVMQVP